MRSRARDGRALAWIQHDGRDVAQRDGDEEQPVAGHQRQVLRDAAEHLRNAQTALSELTGELSSDDLLGEIFATFCIGK